jgi:hypothetical protein
MITRMNRNVRFAGLTALVLAVTLSLAATPLAQEDGTPEPQGEQVIDQIERDSEALITGQYFAYDPEGRRDPFESLVKAQPVIKGKRPKGIKGMLVTEIDLQGITQDIAGRPLALFNGSDNVGYTLREGDLVYDAHLIEIDIPRGFVVFRQEVDDPRRIKPYRDVTKRLNPDDNQDGGMEEGS